MTDKLQKLITENKTYYVNPKLTANNFPKPKTIATENWKLIKMEKRFSSKEALARIKSEGCRPANVWELATWVKSHGGELEKLHWLLAFGQMWGKAGGYHRVPDVHVCVSGGFDFDLGYFEDDWVAGNYLLCFCDSDPGAPNPPIDPLSLETRVKKLGDMVEKIRGFLVID